ncbi:uncharacterized protein [Diadema setosum]|uniref:uncharacterized protein n=1 Tax=Diadema setosum TaxID=31175 RepID=UPI003B3BCBBD
MPGWDDGSGQNLSYASQGHQDYSSDYPASILRSVKEQEAQFEKLTREFEADRLIAANQINRSRVDSETASLNSISETNDSFSWRRSAAPTTTDTAMEEGSSFVVDVPSTDLLDSCLRELNGRNLEDTAHMESLQYADPYASPYNRSNSQISHNPYGGGDYAPHPYGSQDYGSHSDYGSPQHSNYQDYPPSDDGRGYGYTEAPPRDDYHDINPKEIEREDPYGSRDRYDGPAEVEDNPYRSPSPIAPNPYGSISKMEDPYQASPGYKEFAPKQEDPYQSSAGYRDYSPTPPPAEEDPYAASRQPYDEYHPEARGRDPDVEERSSVGTLERTRNFDPFIPTEKAQYIFWPHKYRLGHHHHHHHHPDRLSRKSSKSSLGSRSEGDWRAPDLQEVIDYLGHENQSIVAHAAGYIQHLSYQNDDVKTKTREYGGIQPLVGLLGNPLPEIHRSACGSLRNLSFGKMHEENKVKIKGNGGIPALARLIRTSDDPETKELAAGTLWNLSSSEPLKKSIMEDALVVLLSYILIPESGWKPSGNSPFKDEGTPWSKTLINATGCLRNISSAGLEARRRMRECEGMVDTLLHLVKSGIHSNDLDGKVMENTLCILRNLTFRIANEANHPDAVPLRQTSVNADHPSQQKKGSPQSGSLICFGGSKKKDAQATTVNGTAGKSGTWNPSMPIPNLKQDVKGAELLWQPSIVSPYLTVLSDCSNPASLEAAAGTIQNISAGEWNWAMYIRAEMRKVKGLPILVELLRMKNDRVLVAVAKALRNLAMDPRNKELIGKYGMQDLVERLPASRTGRRIPTESSANETIVAILNTMHELISKNQENAKSLRGASGIDRLVSLTKTKGAYPAAVVKAAYKVLYMLWSYKDMRPQYKKDGWDESMFHTSSTFTTLPRKKTMPDGALPPTASDVENKDQLGRANSVPAKFAPQPIHQPYVPSQPTRPAPELTHVHPDEPPPPFDDPYDSYHKAPLYDERPVDTDYNAEEDLIQRLEPYTRESISTMNSQERLVDDRSIPGEEISMQPMGDFQEDPYATTGRKTLTMGGVSNYGRVPEPEIDHSGYSSIRIGSAAPPQDQYDGNYRDYSTAGSIHDYSAGGNVHLEADGEPAGDSWV